MTDFDRAVREYEERRDQGTSAASVSLLEGQDPAKVAKARKVAAELGLPSRVVEQDFEGFSRRVQHEADSQAIRDNPWMASFFAADPERARVRGPGDVAKLAGVGNSLQAWADKSSGPVSVRRALGSTSGLSPIGRAATTDSTFRLFRDVARDARSTPEADPINWSLERGLRRTGGLLYAGAAGTSQAVTGIALSIEEQREQIGQALKKSTGTSLGFGLNAAGFLRDYAAEQKAISETMRPDLGEGVYAELMQGIESVPLSLAAGYLAVRGNPGAGLAMMGAATGGQEYIEGRAQGLNPTEALVYGAGQGGLEATWESTPLRFLSDVPLAAPLGKKIMGYLVREVGTEVGTEITQQFNRWAAIESNQGKSFGEFASELPSDVRAAALGALMVSGAIGGLQTVAHRTSRETQVEIDRVETATKGQEWLDAVMGASEDIEMRKLDPETFQSFIDERTENSPARHLYLPVEAVERVLAQEDLAPETSAFLEGYRAQIEEAQRTRGDIVVPLAEAVAKLAGTPTWEALRDDARVTPAGLSPRQAREQGETILKQLEQRGEEIAQEALDDTETMRPVAEVYARAKNEMLSAGVPSRRAEPYAQVFAAQREAAAKRMGMSIADYEKLRPVSFTGKAAKATGRKLAQADTEAPAFQKWFGESKGVDENGAPLAMYHATTKKFDAFSLAKSKGGFYFAASEKEARNSRHRTVFGTTKIVPAYLSVENPKIVTEVNDFYRRTAEDREELEKEGYDGIFLVDEAGVIKEAIAFKPTQIKSVDNEGAFDPGNASIYKQGPKGQATFLESGAKIISLFGTADASTMIHEMGHVFLEEMFEDAKLPQAPAELKADVEKIKAWMAANGHPVGATIPTEAHEMWARTFELYAREGKAPSPELRSAFSMFRQWLLDIYKTVARLKAPITPEIRDIMNRMLATDEAIAANRIAPMSREALDMTEAEYAAYLESVQGVQDSAHDTLLGKMMAQVRRRDLKRIREQRDIVEGDVTAEVNSTPEFVALHLLRTGAWLNDPERPRQDVKLHTGWLIDNYGEEVLAKLPKGLPITRGDGLDGDTIAEMTGMPSGDALVQSLLEGRRVQAALKEVGEKRSPREKLIADRTEREMAERHGDIALSDEAIKEEAIAALNSERQGQVIATEIRQLRKRADEGGPSTPYQIAREWARRKVNNGRVGEIATRAAVQRYIRATNKAQRAAEEAILAGDGKEAFRQKQAQMLNHALLAESKAAADDVDTIVKRMNRLAKRATMGSVDQDYFDRIHELLERFDFRQRSLRAVDEQESFNDWARRQIDKGLEVHIPARLMDVGEHYSRVTVNDLLALDDAVKSLLHLGRLKQKILDARAERDFNALRDDIVARIARLPDRTLPDSPIEDERRFGAQAAAALLKVESIADELDGDPDGPLNRLLVQRATQAATKRDELTEQVIVPLARLYASMSKAQRNRLDTKVTIPELTWNTLREGDPRLGQSVTMTRMQLLSVALNSGNVSNLEKMSRGERWPVASIQAVLQREMNKDDWDFVQAVWRGLDGLWPEIVAVEKELSGVAPERVVPMDIETPFGPYLGGYWPVVYDGARSQRAENNADDEVNDLFGFRAGIGTPKGHTITRTGAIGPIRFSLEEVLLHHTEKVVTRIAYAPWVRDVIRVIENPKIRGMIDTRLGAEYRRQIKPWLRRQIAANAIDRRGGAWWEKTLRTFRTNMATTTMGFAFSTGIAQTLGLGFSIGRLGATGKQRGHLVGLKYMALGMRRMLNPVSSISVGAGALAGGVLMGPVGVGVGATLATIATGKLNGFQAAETFVFSRSPEMARRGQEMNREVVEVFQKLRGGKAGWWANGQAMAFWHIGMIDRYMVAMPTWLGAHQKGLDEGMTDEEASAFGDKAVRLSQGSGREKDLAAVQSPNSEAFRFLTMFYTPFSVQFNAQWESVRAAKAGDWRKAMVISTTFLMMTALADALQSGDWPEDDEGDGMGFTDLAEWFGRNVFFSLFAGIPIARDATGTGERLLTGKYASGFAQTPISSAGDAIWKAGEGSYKIAFEDEEVTGRYIKQMSVASGYAFGLPGGQIGKTGGFLWDYGEGEVEPETVRDWYSGLAYGKVPEKKE